jgi:transcriptional regulator GlxA family with amidase domain
MPDHAAKLVVAVLAVPESTASTLYGMAEVLESAGRDWGMITDGSPGESLIRPVIVSATGQGFRSANGLWIEPAATLAECPRPDVIAIPDLQVAPDEDIAGRHPREIEWLREHAAAGVIFAAACTGAFVLAEAGLLDGLDVTTHWAYCDAMARRYPSLHVQPNRALVVSGEDQRFILAGGGTSWQDLALYLIARLVGAEEAMRVARLHLLDWHHVGQQPFAMLSRSRQSNDAAIARCQEWIAQHYDQDAPVAAMARLSGLSERSFKRRFATATGMSPLEYVHALRLEESKHMLETTPLPVETIAHEVGYGDASFFGRLFRRKVGLTPAQYRRRFQSLRHALGATVGAARGFVAQAGRV